MKMFVKMAANYRSVSHQPPSLKSATTSTVGNPHNILTAPIPQVIIPTYQPSLNYNNQKEIEKRQLIQQQLKRLKQQSEPQPLQHHPHNHLPLQLQQQHDHHKKQQQQQQQQQKQEQIQQQPQQQRQDQRSPHKTTQLAVQYQPNKNIKSNNNANQRITIQQQTLKDENKTTQINESEFEELKKQNMELKEKIAILRKSISLFCEKQYYQSPKEFEENLNKVFSSSKMTFKTEEHMKLNDFQLFKRIQNTMDQLSIKIQKLNEENQGLVKRVTHFQEETEKLNRQINKVSESTQQKEKKVIPANKVHEIISQQSQSLQNQLNQYEKQDYYQKEIIIHESKISQLLYEHLQNSYKQLLQQFYSKEMTIEQQKSLEIIKSLVHSQSPIGNKDITEIKQSFEKRIVSLNSLLNEVEVHLQNHLVNKIGDLKTAVSQFEKDKLKLVEKSKILIEENKQKQTQFKEAKQKIIKLQDYLKVQLNQFQMEKQQFDQKYGILESNYIESQKQSQMDQDKLNILNAQLTDLSKVQIQLQIEIERKAEHITMMQDYMVEVEIEKERLHKTVNSLKNAELLLIQKNQDALNELNLAETSRDNILEEKEMLNSELQAKLEIIEQLHDQVTLGNKTLDRVFKESTDEIIRLEDEMNEIIKNNQLNYQNVEKQLRIDIESQSIEIIQLKDQLKVKSTPS